MAKTTTIQGSRKLVRPSDLLKPEFIFLLFALPVCICYCLLFPAGAGYDEVEHVSRTYQLAHGQVLADPDEAFPFMPSTNTNLLYGGFIDESLWSTVDQNKRLFQEPTTAEDLHVYAFPTWADEAFDTDGDARPLKTLHYFSNTAIYSPVCYLPQVIGFWVGCAFGGTPYALVVFMRIFGFAAFAAAVFFAIKLAPVGKWPLVCIALMPQTLSTVSTVSADTMCIATCFLLIVFFLRFVAREGAPKRWEWIVLGACCAFLALMKPTYLPLAALVLCIPLWNKQLRERTWALRLIALFIGTVVLFALWYACIHDINTGAMWNKGIDPDQQKAFILSHPLHYLKILVQSALGQNVFSLGDDNAYIFFSARRIGYTGWLMVPLICLACALHDNRERVSNAFRNRSWLLVIVFAVLFAMVMVLMLTALYLQFTAPGSDVIEGMQNRYFVPILPLILIPISLLVWNMNAKSVPIKDEDAFGSAASNAHSNSTDKAALPWKQWEPSRKTAFVCTLVLLGANDLIMLANLTTALYAVPFA